MYNLTLSPAGEATLERVRAFIADEIEPVTDEFQRLTGSAGHRWRYAPRQIEILAGLKAKARAQGLWNFFLPSSPLAPAGCSNLDYAYLAEAMGRNALASECFNCSAPDSGNMEILARFGTEEQQARWLQPLLNGEMRSCFAMSEPSLASSDARNISSSAVPDGDQWLINGEKFFVSGAGDPRCRFMICMVKTDASAAPDRQQSQIIVPLDTPGVAIVGPMLVFGHDDAPHGHMHIKLENVRVPRENVILGAGRGFEISQARLGPGRIHHCMRAIGLAEKALQLMCERGVARQAFGKPLIRLGGNMELVSRSRIEIESMRLMTLRAARAMDILPRHEARIWIHALKAMVPAMAAAIVDRAIQLHGGAGVSQWSPLWSMYVDLRVLRIADGPDEVHHLVVGRNELSKYSRSIQLTAS